MASLDRVLASDPRETLQFFFSWLRDVTSGEAVDEPAVLYNASVLAHFASTSAATSIGLPSRPGGTIRRCSRWPADSACC